MNRVFSARSSPVNRFEFSAPVQSQLQAPRFLKSTAIPVVPPDSSKSKSQSLNQTQGSIPNSSQNIPELPSIEHNNNPPVSTPRQRFAQSQRSPRRPFNKSFGKTMMSTQEVMPYGRKPPKPPRESSVRSYHHPYTASPTESRKSLAAAQPIREYMIHFDKLVEMARDYLKTNPTFSYFNDDCKKLLDIYEIFIIQSSNHFSTNNPDDDPRPTIKTTPIYKAAKNLLGAWAKFIESTNTIENEGLSPYINIINDSFDQLIRTLRFLRRSMPNIRYKTDPHCVSFEQFQNNVLSFQDEINEQILAPKEIRFKTFDANHFHRQITFLMRQIFDIYAHSLPHSCISLAVKIQTRTELSTSIANISSAVLAARKSDEMFNLMKGEIILANQRLTSIFQRMNFPFSVSLIFDKDEKNDKNKTLKSGIKDSKGNNRKDENVDQKVSEEKMNEEKGDPKGE
ncbi:hypothetical protein TRFO_06262 [Tritrichomonas foetus]|uniref:Uncharacterized protein n=1 Tax=Tritrichomonas foetus TaxID=1144522 RepID=A0A1J4K054_9EUKA|nr:hypothetical protein TRFO_06262 [Tritrichomonas foetus]|eukprot:OHT04799.1 hypothetical protein TRFO_06262 [Tritrichomonas foetus]